MPIRRPIIRLRCWPWKHAWCWQPPRTSARLPIADFFVDTFTTALEPGEIIQEVIVPVEDQSTGTSYQKNDPARFRFRHRGHRGPRPQVRRKGRHGPRRRHRPGGQTLSGHQRRKGAGRHRRAARPIFRRPPRWWPTASMPIPICTPPPTIANTWLAFTPCARWPLPSRGRLEDQRLLHRSSRPRAHLPVAARPGGPGEVHARYRSSRQDRRQTNTR